MRGVAGIALVVGLLLACNGGTTAPSTTTSTSTSTSSTSTTAPATSTTTGDDDKPQVIAFKKFWEARLTAAETGRVDLIDPYVDPAAPTDDIKADVRADFDAGRRQRPALTRTALGRVAQGPDGRSQAAVSADYVSEGIAFRQVFVLTLGREWLLLGIGPREEIR